MTFTLKIESHLFGDTLQFMIMHHHPRFGFERLNSSKDAKWTDEYRDRVIPIKPPNFVNTSSVDWTLHRLCMEMSFFERHKRRLGILQVHFVVEWKLDCYTGCELLYNWLQ